MPGISRTVGARCNNQANATWAGVAPKRLAVSVTAGALEHRVLRVKCRAEREEGHVRHAVAPAGIEKGLVRTVSDAVRVLDACNVGATARHEVLLETHVAQADAGDEAFLAQSDHRLDLLGERHVGFGVPPQIDHGDLVEHPTRPGWPQRRPAALPAAARQPLTRFAAGGADFRDEDEVSGYGWSAA